MDVFASIAVLVCVAAFVFWITQPAQSKRPSERGRTAEDILNTAKQLLDFKLPTKTQIKAIDDLILLKGLEAELYAIVQQIDETVSEISCHYELAERSTTRLEAKSQKAYALADYVGKVISDKDYTDDDAE